MNITRIATLSTILAATMAEGTVRLSFTENYTPPAADAKNKAHPDLFIHLDASNFETMSYDADANGNLRLASIADPRDNGFYASNSISQAASSRATIRPCALNGRSVLDLGEFDNVSSAADLRWCYGGSYTNCRSEIDAFIVYANRDEGHYADPFTDYNGSNSTWQNGGDKTLFSTNSPKAADNLLRTQQIFIDGVQTGNGVPFPSGYHLLYVHNYSGWTLPLHGVGAHRNMRQGGMLVAEVYVFCQNVWGTSYPNAITNHLMKKWGLGGVEPYAPPSLSGLTAAMDANGKLDSLALAGGVLAPGNGGAATISLPSGFVPRTGDYPLLTGATLAEGAEAALASWTVSFTPAVEAKAMLAVEDDDVVLRVLPSHTVIYMR